MAKKQYRVRNWKDYNRSLKERGNISIWIDQTCLMKWYAKSCNGKGRPKKYSDFAIEIFLKLKIIFHMALRQGEGFISSIVELMGLELDIPDYSTVCRRQKNIKIEIIGKNNIAEGIHLLIDSSGLKIFGQGEWNVRQHGYTKRRTWKKIHIGVNEDNIIEIMELTGGNVADSKVLKKLLSKTIRRFGKIIGDKGYDGIGSYEAIMETGAKAIIPPRNNSKIQYPCGPPLRARNEAIQIVRRRGKDIWAKETEYHRRSLVENMFFRFKTIFGPNLSARKFDNEETEATLKCKILNEMTLLGRPKSYIAF